MPRIRSIKPELPRDATLAKVPREMRYTFILLLTQADDDGFFIATPRHLLGALYPHDPDITEGDLVRELDRLRSIGRLRCFDTPDGVVGEIVNFKKHQKIDNRSKAYLATLSLVPRETFGVGVLSLGVLSQEPRVRSQESRPARETVASLSDVEAELLVNLPADCHQGLGRILGAAGDRRDYVAAAIRAVGPGGVHQEFSWAEIGQAIHDLLASNDASFQPRRFRVFARKIREDAQGRGPGGSAMTPAEVMIEAAKAKGAA